MSRLLVQGSSLAAFFAVRTIMTVLLDDGADRRGASCQKENISHWMSDREYNWG